MKTEQSIQTLRTECLMAGFYTTKKGKVRGDRPEKHKAEMRINIDLLTFSLKITTKEGEGVVVTMRIKDIVNAMENTLENIIKSE